jgi:hypothetical protein
MYLLQIHCQSGIRLAESASEGDFLKSLDGHRLVSGSLSRRMDTVGVILGMGDSQEHTKVFTTEYEYVVHLHSSGFRLHVDRRPRNDCSRGLEHGTSSP